MPQKRIRVLMLIATKQTLTFCFSWLKKVPLLVTEMESVLDEFLHFDLYLSHCGEVGWNKRMDL